MTHYIHMGKAKEAIPTVMSFLGRRFNRFGIAHNGVEIIVTGVDLPIALIDQVAQQALDIYQLQSKEKPCLT